jgi:hypothetical protein
VAGSRSISYAAGGHILTQATGERNASISHPRGRGAAAVKAINGKVELGELRRGYAVSEGADHSKMLLKSRAQRLVKLTNTDTRSGIRAGLQLGCGTEEEGKGRSRINTRQDWLVVKRMTGDRLERDDKDEGR